MPKIRDVASIPVYCVRENDDLNHARKEMIRRGVDKLVVLDPEDKVAGIVTVTDLVNDAANLATSVKRRLHLRQGTVKEVMSRDVFTMNAANDAGSAIEEFARRDLVAAPVMDDGDLIGIVTAHDLMPAVRERLEGREMVRNVMDPDVVRLHRHDSLPHALHALAKAHAYGGIVTEAESDVTKVGVITLDMILMHGALEPTAPDGKRVQSTRKLDYGGRASGRHVDYEHAIVEDAMWMEHPTIKYDAGASAATQVIETRKVDVIPVMDEGGAVLGIVTKRHLIGAAARAMKAEA